MNNLGEDITPEDSVVPIYLKPETKKELDDRLKEQKNVEAEIEARENAKASAAIKLAKLGLTLDEINAITGTS